VQLTFSVFEIFPSTVYKTYGAAMDFIQESRHIFGPVHSRRLGFSLGIDVVPAKTCTFNCIFCQLGRTTHQTIERQEYVPTEEVMTELEAYLEKDGKADYLTFSGSGEPTLHSKIGEMIARTKQMTKIPVAVLTCGALLYDPQVRRELAPVDVVLPSLNAISPAVFRAVNRPHGALQLAAMIDGLRRFRREYRGRLWLEIMFVKSVNDDPAEIARLQRAIAEIKPDKVHLTTVARPPAESETLALTSAELKAIATALGAQTEVVLLPPPTYKLQSGDSLIAEVVNLIARRPAKLEEICEQVNCKHDLIWLALNALIEAGAVKVRNHQGKKFYAASDAAALIGQS
jgi:wyosine [tRNA(Phe)-imidazoG37] synthetase (radical SAM superfamily)